MKKFLIISIVFIAFTQLFAQQNTTFSQYMLNYYSVNPAVAGTETYMPIAIGFHQSWTGFTNAPSMQMLSGHTSINNEMAVGAKIYNFSTGPSRKTGFEGTYAYKFDLGNDMHLSLGLSVMMYQMYLDITKLDMKDQDDDALYGSSAQKIIVPDASFGGYFYAKNYFAGISINQLFNRKVDFATNYLKEEQVRHYYLIGGYNYEINDDFTVQPSLMGKFIEAGVFQMDINAKVIYKKMFFGGLSYRIGESAVMMLGIDTKNLTFGYSYDYTLSEIGKYSNGSHEIMLIIKLGGKSSASL